MKYEKVSDPTYKFEFNSQEATTLADIMNVVLSMNATEAFSSPEKDFAQVILNKFDDSDL